MRYISLHKAAIHDIGPLTGLEQLQSIWINETRVANIVPLSFLPQLRSLFADQTPVSQLRGWNPQCPLVNLSIANTRVTNVQPLASTQLQTLNLRGTPIADLQGIDRMQRLRGLDISQTNVASLAEVLKNPCLMYSIYEPRGEGGSFRFADTPVARRSARLSEIAAMAEPQEALRVHFKLPEPSNQNPISRPRQGRLRRLLRW